MSRKKQFKQHNCFPHNFFRKEHSLWRSSPNISPANVSQHVADHHFLLESKRKLVLPLIIFQSCMAKVNIHDDKRHVFISRDRESETTATDVDGSLMLSSTSLSCVMLTFEVDRATLLEVLFMFRVFELNVVRAA